jgi:hypothetical protein
MPHFYALSAFRNASIEGYKLKEIFFRAAKQNLPNVRKMRSISFREPITFSRSGKFKPGRQRAGHRREHRLL